jgi:hypothetical protein
MSDEERLHVTERNGAVRFAVRVQPRSSKLGIMGLQGTSLKICVHSPPVGGAANDEIIEVLSSAMGVARRNVLIVSGERSRNKVVEISGVDGASVRDSLNVPQR